MRQTFPVVRENVDPDEVYGADARAHDDDRPWVLSNMITSLDGAISIDGVSGGLGGPGDKAVFSAIRSVADVIVVGAGTVRAENYRRPQTTDRQQRARIARGQAAFPRLAIVTGRLGLPADHRVFDAGHPPLILTHEAAPEDRRAALDDVAEIVDVGATSVDVGRAVTALGERGARVILVEGGQSLNGAMVDADLVDELCLTLSPMLVGGDGPGMVAGAAPSVERRYRLDRMLHDDDLAFLRYLRRGATGAQRPTAA